MFAQLRHLGIMLPQAQDIDEVWNWMLMQCEEFPEQLRTHSLSIYTSIVKHHHQAGNMYREEESSTKR